MMFLLIFIYVLITGMRYSFISSLSANDDGEDEFFNEIDNNGNDNITFEEITTFVQENLDLESQDSAVENIFRSLDSNGDQVLHRADFKELWATIGSALSVEEVVEWAEHAQQLPEEIAKEFSRHRITGYDFPELVDDDGALLEKELGIRRQGLKKRVLRSMKLILLGANQKPVAPSHFSATPITCSRVKIDWEMTSTNNTTFPVHKFVVQRAVKDSVILPLAPWNSPLPQHQWATVYEGLETECDDWVPAGYAGKYSSHRIFYRVTGWNALGRSERIVVALNTNNVDIIPCPIVDRIFCTSNSIINMVRTPSMLSLLMLSISLVCVILAGMYMLLFTVTVKPRRRKITGASHPNTATSIHTNRSTSGPTSVRLPDRPIRSQSHGTAIPPTHTTAFDAKCEVCSGGSSKAPQSAIGTIITSSGGVRVSPTDLNRHRSADPSDRTHANSNTLQFHHVLTNTANGLATERNGSRSTSPVTTPSLTISAAAVSVPIDRMGSGGSAASNLSLSSDPYTLSTSNQLTGISEILTGSDKSNGRSDGHLMIDGDEKGVDRPPLRRRVSFQQRHIENQIIDNNQNNNNRTASMKEANGSNGNIMNMSSHSHNQNNNNTGDENNRCLFCDKPYRMLKWKWRMKHYCCYCGSTFCSNCGEYDHLEILQCKISGNCKCNRCIVMLRSKKAAATSRSRSQSPMKSHVES